VKANWEKLKLKEGKKSVLEGVPASLPALIKAIRIQDKVKGVGFDWSDIADVKAKVSEELAELQEAIDQEDANAIEDEFGDVLFSLVNYSRFLKVNPEDALERTNRKFLGRFRLMETLILEAGKDLSEMDLEQMDVYWEQAKKALRAQ
jgi:XTP/dITP diphosphohydrolase